MKKIKQRTSEINSSTISTKWGLEPYRRFCGDWIDIIIEEKGGPECSRCGYNKFFSAIDFHHIGTKRFNISNFFANPPTTENIKIFKEEIKNCIMLCANCHREEHTKKHRLINKKSREYFKLERQTTLPGIGGVDARA